MRVAMCKVYIVYSEVGILGRIYEWISRYVYIQGLPRQSVGRGALF